MFISRTVRPISAVNSTLWDSEWVGIGLSVIVALMSKCVYERENVTKRGRGQMCVPDLVSYYVPLRLPVCPRTYCFIPP